SWARAPARAATAVASARDIRALRRLKVSLAATTVTSASAPAAIARSTPTSFSTSASSCVPGRRSTCARTAAESAICGTARGPARLELVGADGLRLRADRYDSPLARGTVVLLHGGGQNRHSWSRTAVQATARGWDAVTIDARGHGDSDWAPDGDYSPGAMVRDL